MSSSMASQLLQRKPLDRFQAEAEGRAGRPGAQARARPDRPRDAGHRRDHRHRDLRADGRGGGRPRRPGRGRLVRGRGARLRLRGPLLRRIRDADPDLGQRLQLRLRDARRDRRLDHRLGPDPRVRRRLLRRGERLVGLFPRDPREHGDDASGRALARAGDRRGRAGQSAGAARDPRGLDPARDRDPRERAHQRGDRGAQAGRDPVRDRGGLLARGSLELAPVRALRLERGDGGRRDRVLLLHRLRLRDDRRRGIAQSRARHADRNPRLARDLHAALSRRLGGGDGDGPARRDRQERPAREGLHATSGWDSRRA